MFSISVFIGILMFFCCTSSLSQPFEEGGTIKKRAKRNIYKDFNHPGNLIHVHSLQWEYSYLDNDVTKKARECKTIMKPDQVPEQYESREVKLFHHDYRQWWAIFKYSKSDVIRKLNKVVQKLVRITNDEEKASLMAYLNCELCRISEQGIVYRNNVTVNASDVESVIGALRVWGMKDEKLLNAARAVHGVWGGIYWTDNVVWPRNDFEKSTKSSE